MDNNDWKMPWDKTWVDGWSAPLNKPTPQPCLHDGCTRCHGTGKDEEGKMCVHHISCPCPKCTVMC